MNHKTLYRAVLGAAMLLVHLSPDAMTITINTPANGTIVTPGQTLSVSVTVSGAVAGISQITISGERDADGFNDVYSFNPSPPTNSATRTGSYRVPFDAASGEQLTISASAQGYADDPVNTSIDVQTAVLTPPANDNFANSILIMGESGSVTGSNTNGTKETGEPNHAGYPGGKSVWWRWVAPITKVVEFDTKTSNFDTLLAVYTGSSVSALTLIASDDQSGGFSTSKLQFSAVAGTTYHIAVDGYSAASGNIKLSWNQNVPVALTMTGNPIDFEYDPIRNRYYVANFTNSRIEVINPATASIIGNIPLPGTPNSISVSPDGNRIIAALEASDTVAVIDVNTSSVLQTTTTAVIANGNGPRFAEFMDNDLVLVGLGSGFGNPLRYRISTNLLEKTTIGSGQIFIGVSTPHLLSTSPERHRAVVTDGSYYPDVYAYDATLSQTRYREVPSSEVRHVEMSPHADQFMFVDNAPTHRLRIMDSVTLQDIIDVPYPNLERAAYIRDRPGMIVGIVSGYSGANQVHVIRASDGTMTSSTPLEMGVYSSSSSSWIVPGAEVSGKQRVMVIDRSFDRLWFLDVPAATTAASDWYLLE
ncbi:MAG: YncE family protein [Candidatus Sumerlaeaceae bacterium]